ncbi:hypothetical protein LZ30DRAFT_216761 [Colletotrichum cereale]|nr:hypothetical protein LZ30DRAFT_216761 [Colletotrichum cereale]
MAVRNRHIVAAAPPIGQIGPPDPRLAKRRLVNGLTPEDATAHYTPSPSLGPRSFACPSQAWKTAGLELPLRYLSIVSLSLPSGQKPLLDQPMALSDRLEMEQASFEEGSGAEAAMGRGLIRSFHWSMARKAGDARRRKSQKGGWRQRSRVRYGVWWVTLVPCIINAAVKVSPPLIRPLWTGTASSAMSVITTSTRERLARQDNTTSSAYGHFPNCMRTHAQRTERVLRYTSVAAQSDMARPNLRNSSPKDRPLRPVLGFPWACVAIYSLDAFLQRSRAGNPNQNASRPGNRPRLVVFGKKNRDKTPVRATAAATDWLISQMTASSRLSPHTNPID